MEIAAFTEILIILVVSLLAFNIGFYSAMKRGKSIMKTHAIWRQLYIDGKICLDCYSGKKCNSRCEIKEEIK